MEVLSFSLRALKRPNCTMVVGFIFGFGLRTLWATVIWNLLGGSVATLFLAYGVSAFCAMVTYAIIFAKVIKKEKNAIPVHDV